MQRRVRTLLGSALGAAVIGAGLKEYNDRAVRKAVARFPPLGEFVEVDDVRLHYLSDGTGPPVVFLHASGLVLRDFTSIFDKAAAAYHAIAFDRPGYGYSTRPANERLTLALSARLIHDALLWLGIEQPILVGHSGGGSVALRYALDYGDEIAGLVLIAPGAYAEGLPLPPLSRLTDPPILGTLFRHLLLAPLVQMAAPLFVGGLFAPNSPPQGYVNMIRGFAVRPEHFYTHAEELKWLPSGLSEQSPDYGGISVPVTILAGAADKAAPPDSQAQRLHEAMPHSKLILVPEAGHAVHHQHPEIVLEEIRRVWQRKPILA